MPEKPAAAEPTEIAGRFQVVSKLGAGAFGTVYKAKDKVLGRMLAIKTIRLDGLAAQGASLDELLDRFKREAEVSAQLKHPNIVTIYDIGDCEGLSYLAMEFIDGVGLDKVISAAGHLSVERAASIAAQVADALAYAHKHNVVHRDIKPGNVMIEAGDRVKVTDFGIAKVIDSGEHLTMTGSLLGTPSYMSPEQARGGTIDGRSDIFAVGCILYEMLTGKKAFRGESITALIFKIITEEPQPIQELDPTIPEPLVQIIKKAMSKAPETRYQTGQELAADLATFTTPAAVPTLRQAEAATLANQTPQSPTVQLSSTAVKAAPTQVARAAVPDATKMTTQPTVAGPPRAPRPTGAVPPPARKSKLGLVLALLAVGGIFVLAAAGAGWYFFLRKSAPGPQATPEPVAVAQTQLTPTPELSATETPTPVPPTNVDQTTAIAPANTPLSRPTRATREELATPEPTAAPRVADRPEASAPQASGEDYAFLEHVPTEDVDGTEAGDRAAEAYRGRQGGSNGGSFGTSRPLRSRKRIPPHTASERPAVGMLWYLMNAEEAYKRKSGRYGSLNDLSSLRTVFLDVPYRPRGFQRRGYRFELELEDDGFRIAATPMGPGRRHFMVDDSGFIRPGVD